MNGLSRNKHIPLIILAGGFGTRLRSLDATRPKPMVLVNERPFLYWLIKFYSDMGHQHFLISTGYKAEVIESYPWTGHFPHCQFEFFREENPLGTGGAVQFIFHQLPSLQAAWVVNGDTLLPQPLPDPESQGDADIIYVVLNKGEVFDATPNLAVEGDFVVAEVKEGDYFDAGAVYINRQAMERYKGEKPVSFHKLASATMALHRARYVLVSGTCYDIGTPDRYQRFVNFISC